MKPGGPLWRTAATPRGRRISCWPPDRPLDRVAELPAFSLRVMFHGKRRRCCAAGRFRRRSRHVCSQAGARCGGAGAEKRSPASHDAGAARDRQHRVSGERYQRASAPVSAVHAAVVGEDGRAAGEGHSTGAGRPAGRRGRRSRPRRADRGGAVGERRLVGCAAGWRMRWRRRTSRQSDSTAWRISSRTGRPRARRATSSG